MLLSLIVAALLLSGSLLVYGAAIHLIVRVLTKLMRARSGSPGFWRSTAVMAIATSITSCAHLAQIALWALAFLACGQAPTFETAFYLSAQNCTALGYGDVLLAERWRLLGPLEAINGLLFFGLSTAVLFSIVSHMIDLRLRNETGYDGVSAAGPAPASTAGSLASTSM